MRFKYFSVLFLLLVLFGSLSVVCASDDADDAVLSQANVVENVDVDVSVDDLSASYQSDIDDNVSDTLNPAAVDDGGDDINQCNDDSGLLGVSDNNDNEVLGDYSNSFSCLQEIINNATSGSMVNLTKSYSYQNATDYALIDGIVINKPLLIDGKGYTVSGSSMARIFKVTSANVAFQDITFDKGYRAYSATDRTANKIHGGCLYITTGTNINFTRCKFSLIPLYRASYDPVGSGIYAQNVNRFNVINCTFTTNGQYLVYRGGGIYFEGSNILIQGSNFTNLRTTNEGGSLFFAGNNRNNITVDYCRFTGTNTEPDSIIYVNNGAKVLINNNYFNCQCYNGIVDIPTARADVNITYNNFTNCYTTYDGAILLGTGKHGDVLISHNIFTNGNYGYRPLMLRSGANSGTLTVEWNYFNGVHSRTESGTITVWDANYKRVNIYNNTFNNCRSQTLGGTIRTASPTYIEDNNFTNCYLHGNGGTVYSRGVAIYATNYTYVNNNNFTGNRYSATPLIAEGIIYISSTGTGVITNNNFTNNNVNSSLSSHTGIIHNEGNNTIIANNSFKNSNCSGASGGIVYNLGNNVTISNINISTVNASTGGAIYNGGSNINISNINVTNSLAITGGAFYILGDNVNVSNCNFTNNHADNYGVIYCDAPNSRLYNNTYTNNYAINQGVLAIGSNIQVIKQNFKNNNVTNGYAGTILIIGNDNYFDDINISKTSALEGGAIYVTGDRNNLSNINIDESMATSTHGGAVYSTGFYLNINNLTVSNTNASIDGGAVYSTGEYSNIHNASFTNVHAGRNGGVIFWTGNNGNISLINITDAYAGSNGGAIYWSGINGTIKDLFVNRTQASIGGVVYCVGPSTKILGGSFDDTHATGDGGAIFWTGSNANITGIIFNKIYSGANGGAIYGTATDSSFNNLSFNDINATENGGVLYWAGARSYLYNINVTNANSVTGSGGAFYWSGDKSGIRKARFENVTSEINGAVYWTGFESYIDNVTFVNCVAKDQGGAVYWTGSDSNLTNGVFINNSASNGGAVFWNAVRGNLTNATFFFNNVSADGGAVYLIGDSPYMYNLTFVNNTAGFKGGAVNVVGMDPVFHLLNCTNNSAGVDGGAVIIDGSDAILIDSNFVNNTAVSSGGAVYLSGIDANIANVNFTGNGAGIGGAFYCAGDNCTVIIANFTDNNATTGGALYMGGLRDGKVFNSTFEGNNATGSGGAVYWTGSNGAFLNSTVIGSNARDGGAVYWTGDVAILDKLTFDDIYVTDNGAILYVSASYVNVSNSNFINSNASSGGAVYWLGADGVLFNANFTNNSAALNGGAVYWMGNNANLTTVNFIKNNASFDGGALYIVSFGASLDDINFFNNSAANYGGGMYWGGNGNIAHGEFKFNDAYSGSAIYNSGTLNILSFVMLNNTANISSIDINTSQTASELQISAVVHGLDNFLNAIWTTSDNIQVNDVTYFGVGGELHSGNTWRKPIEGISDVDLYFDSRVPGISVVITCDLQGGNVTNSAEGNTSIQGEFNYSIPLSTLDEGRYDIFALHYEDDYYFMFSSYVEEGVGVRYPTTFTVTFVEPEIYYGGEATIKSLVIVTDKDGDTIDVNGIVDVYIDDEPLINITLEGTMDFTTIVLPDKYEVGTLHSIKGYFHNATDKGNHQIGSSWSSPYYFNIVRNYKPSIVNVSTVNSTYYVDEEFNLTFSGPVSYRGPIYYVAGVHNGTVQLNETTGLCNITLSYPIDGTVDVLVYVGGDDNYLPSSSTYSFNIIKRDLTIGFVNVTDTSLGNINVGDDAVFVVNLSVNDTVSDVIITVDDRSYNVAVVDSSCSLTVPGLSAGSHVVSARYPGDDKYNPYITNNHVLNVNKVDIESITVTPINSNIFVGDDAVFDIVVNSTNTSLYPVNGVVSVSIAGKSYNISIIDNKGKLNVSGLVNGSYDIMVNYAGDYQFNPKDVSVIGAVIVSKINTAVTVNSPATITVGENVTFNILIESNVSSYPINGIATIKIDNREYDVPISNDEGSINISGLKYNVDAYNVTVVYNGDYQFVNSSNNTTVRVVRKDIQSMDLIVNNTIYVGQDAILNITFTTSDEPVNGFVTVNVDNREFNVSVSDNKGYLKIANLAYNETPYQITVSYDGGDIYNAYSIQTTTVSVLKVYINNIIVIPVEPVISVGDNAVFDITMVPYVPGYFVNGSLVAEVNGRLFNVSVCDNIGRLIVSGLSNGTYDVYIFYAGDATFNPYDTHAPVSSVTVNKIPTTISMNDVKLNVGDIAVIVACINNPDVTGNVTFTVDNKDYTVGIINGVATCEVSGLNTSSDKVMSAKYSGDYKFLNSSCTANLNISKITDSASISVYNIVAGESENVVIVLPGDISNGTVTVKFNDSDLNPTEYVTRGNVITFNRTVDSVGDYTVEVIVSDDAKYDTITASNSFRVSKVRDYSIFATASNVVLGENSTVHVILPDDADDGVVVIAGKSYSVADATAGVVIARVFNIGSYSVDVSYVNSSKYVNKATTAVYEVFKAQSNVSIIIDDVVCAGTDINFTVVAVNSTGKITVIINDKEYSPRNNTPYTIPSGLVYGNYTILVKLDADSNYESSQISKNLEVIKNNVSITLDDITTPIKVNEPVIITVNFDKSISGDVIFDIGGVNYTVTVNNANQAKYTFAPKTNGTYLVKVTYLGNDIFNPNTTTVSKSFVVDKIPTRLIVSSDPIYVGQDALINVEVRDNQATGNVIITVNGKDYVASLVNGKGNVIVSGLTNDTDNSISAVYVGDDKYDSSGNTSSVRVNKVDISFIDVSVNKPMFYVGENAVLTFNILPSVDGYKVNGILSVKVGDGDYNVSIKNNTGSLTVYNLPYGVNVVNVSYAGDDVFNPRDRDYANTITVDKIPVNVGVTPLNQTIFAGGSAVLTVNVSSTVENYSVNGYATVNVADNSYNVSIINGTGSLTVHGLNSGNYDVDVYYDGDSVFTANSLLRSASITVNKIPTTLSMENVYLNVGNVAVIIARVSSPEVTGNVSFIVDNKNYVASIVNGIATLNVYGLNTSANKSIFAEYSGDYKFLNSSTSANLIISKVGNTANITVYDINAGECENVVIVLPSDVSNGTITVKFNNTVLKPTDYSINNNVITFNRTLQISDNYTVDVSVADDAKYNNMSASAVFEVFKTENYDIIVDVDEVVLGENSTVAVTLPDDAVNGMVVINGNAYTVSEAKRGIKLPKADTAGSHNVDVSYTDSKYANKTVTISYNVLKAGSSVSINISDVFYVDEDIGFIVTTVNSTGTIHVTINGREFNPVNNTPYTISGGLANGTYNVIVNLDGDDNYEASETSKVIYIIKKPVSIILDEIISPVNVDDEVTINARFNDTVTGTVIFTIDGVNYTVSVDGVEVSCTYVPKVNGTYYVNAYYSGDDKFNPNSTFSSKSFTVNKIPTQLIISADSINVGQDAVIMVEVRNNEATGNVVVTINGRTYTIGLVDGKGSVTVVGLTNDTDNNISAVYSGDNKYNSSFNTSNIVVNKVDIRSITIDPLHDTILVGENATFDITVSPSFDDYSVNGWVNVSVNNKSSIIPITNNHGRLVVSDLSAGDYPIEIDYAGDVTFNPSNKTFNRAITVNKVSTTLSVAPGTIDVYVGQYATFNVSVKANENGYVVNGYVTVTFNGTSFNASISEGSGKFDVCGLAYGIHPVTVSYAGDDTYKPSSSVEVKVNVKKVPVGITVDPLSQPIFVGDNALLNITITPTVDNYTVNGNAIVTVEGVGEFNVSIANSTGQVTFYDLVNATHNVHVYYAGDDVFESSTFDETINVLVNKIPTNITMGNVSLNVGDDAIIVAVVNYADVTGNMTFIVDNKEYIVGIINGVARLNVTGLNTSANKIITAKYSGDYKYINSTATASLNISKVYGNASIVVYNITAGETETVIINLPADVTNGTIIVKFNDEPISDYVVSNNVISFNRTLQVSANYSVSISVDDDCKYYNFDNSSVFTVFKVAPESYIVHIDVNNSEVFENIPVIVNLPDDANGTLSLIVDNETIDDGILVVGGVATYNLGNLSSGNHTITVIYGNEKYDNKTVSTVVFVSKIASSINITNPVDPRVAHDIIITLTPEPRSTGNITVTINGKEYPVDGLIVNASDLLEGNYTVVAVLAEDDNFLESTNNSLFIVKRNPVSMTLNDVVGDVRVDHSLVLHVDLNETVTGSVIFNINGENVTVNITESNFAEYNWTPTVDTVVTIFASYSGNDTYYSNSTNAIVFDVYKNPITFANIIVEDINVDDIEHIIVSLNESDASGLVTIDINGIRYESGIVDGCAVFDVSDLPAGTYKAVAFYGGDFKYLATNSISDEFNVFKYDCPVVITADDIMVLDDALIIVNVSTEASGHVFITVDNRSVYLPVINGSVSWIVPDLSAGVYEVVAEYSGDYKYLSNSSVGTLNVLKYNSTFDIIRDDVGWTGEDINMSVMLSDDATGNVTVSVNCTEYVLPVSDGKVDFTIPMLGAGDYEVNVTYSGDYKYADAFDSFNFTVNGNYPIINSDNVVKYYKGSERLYVNLTNVRGDKLAGETVYITVNGITYARVTNADGVCSVPINLISGEYAVDVVYNTSSLYDPVGVVVNATVLPTVIGEDLVKVFANASQYYARFVDSEGNALSGTKVTFNINGVFYTRTTDADGWAKLNINLPAGEYIITAYNPVTDEKYSNNITIIPRIVENYDMVKVYKTTDKFSVRVIGDDANPVGAGEKVEFNINGVFYTRTTDADGYARLNINLPPGEYIITTYYNGCTVSNTITVLPEDENN